MELKLKKRVKPDEQKGTTLERWKAKCFKRRQQKRLLGKGGPEANDQPWEKVERKKIQANSKFRFATWNVRTMRTSKDIALVAKDLSEQRILVAGLQECRWLVEENGRKEGDYKFWGGGAWRNDAKASQGGVAIAVHKSLWKSVERFILVSGRTAVITLTAQLGKRIVFCTAWCPVEKADGVQKDAFWKDFQTMASHPDIKRTSADTLIVSGDFNGELPVFDEECGKSLECVVGRWSPRLSEPNENGMRLQEEASKLKLCASNTQIRKPENKIWTYLHRTANRQRRTYDHAFIPCSFRGSVKDSKVIWNTLHESDHGLVITDMKISYFKDKKTVLNSKVTGRLRLAHFAKNLEDSLNLKNMFSELENMQDDEVQSKWTSFQEAVVSKAGEEPTEALIFPKRPWISERTLELIRNRANTKKKLMDIEEEDEHKRESYTIRLRDLRLQIKTSAKKDKTEWIEGTIEDIQKAGNSGDSRKVFDSVKKLSGKRGSAPASLDGIDSDVWVNFFTDLLGKESKPEEVSERKIKETLSWKRCEHNLKPEKRAEPWSVDLNAPVEDEIIEVLKKARKDKSVSGVIPTEFWQNSPMGRKILTIFIQKVWNGATPPEEWLNAALCLLYKQKGSKTSPNSYRGISLLSSAEKIISLIILGRIKPFLVKTMNSRQSGFSTGKSCRNAVFVLLREMERCIAEDKPVIYNFVDFRKAFDSLDWSAMWKVMEAQGMPTKIVGIIKELYNNATVSVRLNSEDKMAPSFRQKVGIRQGCSLSPALFVLVLDFAMKAFMEACEELGIEADAAWLGYADDLAVKSGSVETAEPVFHQLQAACAFVGLHCNTDKTECMAIGMCQKVTPKETACKERIAVTFQDGKFQGWLVDWAARERIVDKTKLAELAELRKERLLPAPSHLIVYDPDHQGQSDIVAIQMGKNGWLTDQDGDKHRCKLLGSKEYVDEKKNRVRCKTCNTVFHSQRALQSHASKCKKRENLSIDEQAKLRRKREANANYASRNTLDVEQVKIKDIFGEDIKAVAEFKYLGTLATTDGWSSKEINRRLGIASNTIVSLDKIWSSPDISVYLKCRLYQALVMTIVLYNGECWTMKKQDLARLEGFHFRCLRRITRTHRCPGMGKSVIDRATKKEVFKTAKLPGIEEMLREKRLRWFGHLTREKDGDPAKETLKQEQTNNSKWFKVLQQDFKWKGISVQEAEEKATDKLLWRKLSSSVYIGARSSRSRPPRNPPPK
jgi:hypothetical protein